MASDEELGARIMETITDWGTTRKKMFGGTCYLLHGNIMWPSTLEAHSAK